MNAVPCYDPTRKLYCEARGHFPVSKPGAPILATTIGCGGVFLCAECARSREPCPECGRPGKENA